jgi:multidrug efflux pump subunit AcrA (membrane-fusion protein)
MSIQKKILFISIPSVFIIAALLFYLNKNNKGDWVPLKKSKITEAIYGLATLESDETFRFRLGVTSQIKKLYVKEGDQVKKGHQLLKLQEGATIHSPIDGVVTQLDTKENETVFPNANLITVMNLEKLVLSITLEQASAIKVQAHQPVNIQFESMTGTPLKGIVRSIYPKDGQFLIKVDLEHTPSNILPGMTADTAIIVGEKAEALLAPKRSVQKGMMLIKKNGEKKKVTVNVGFQDNEHVEIKGANNEEVTTGTEVWVPHP